MSTQPGASPCGPVGRPADNVADESQPASCTSSSTSGAARAPPGHGRPLTAQSRLEP